MDKCEICRVKALSNSEFKRGEVGFVDFAEAEDVGEGALSTFDLEELFTALLAVVKSKVKDAFVVVGFEIQIAEIGVTGI